MTWASSIQEPGKKPSKVSVKVCLQKAQLQSCFPEGPAASGLPAAGTGLPEEGTAGPSGLPAQGTAVDTEVEDPEILDPMGWPEKGLQM